MSGIGPGGPWMIVLYPFIVVAKVADKIKSAFNGGKK